MSRVDAVKVARMKADAIGPDALKGSVAASDAFFPFRDGLDAVADAGATAVVQPGGSVRDQEVIAAADVRGLAMGFIDGGVTGVSMLVSRVTGLPLAALLPAINLPFVALGFHQMGAAFAARSVLGIAGL